MKQSKKIFSKLILNNWGGISHKCMEFHEHVNLFSGKSGSGKSTVMDAIQVVLYGSVSATFLNKAADDSKNKRSVISYLRGAQKDGSFNRENMDFCSQIVLEIVDTGTGITTCIGVSFEVAKNDTDLKKYCFFSHSGPVPENGYLTEQNTPYRIKDLRKLIEKRMQSSDNRGYGEVNRIYPSKESYLNCVYDFIFGGIEPGRFMTMEKSAIALKMSNGTGQFIRDYMFPKSREHTVATISEQLGAYREIKERIDDLAHRIELLDAIRISNLDYQKTKIDKMRAEKILKIVDIEALKSKVNARNEELERIQEKVTRLNEDWSYLEESEEKETKKYIEIEAELKSSDYGQKKKELEEVERTISLASGNSRQWRQILNGLSEWEENEDISAYISNPTLQEISELKQGNVSKERLVKIKKGIDTAQELIDEEYKDIEMSLRELQKSIKEKKEFVEDLSNDRKPYPKELKSARAALQEALSMQYGRTIHVEIFADLFDVVEEEWKSAIEGRLGGLKRSLIVAPEHALDAAKAFRKMRRKEYENINLIDTFSIVKDGAVYLEHSLYESVRTGISYVDICLKRFLGKILKCETVEELQTVRDGVTKDCYSYSNYVFRHLREADYEKYACIGTKVSKAKLRQMEEEVYELEQRFLEESQMCISLKQAKDMEHLSYDIDQLLFLSQSADNLEKYLKKKEELSVEIRELSDGTYTSQLTEKRNALAKRISEIKDEINCVRDELLNETKDQSRIESELGSVKERLSLIEEGFVCEKELIEETCCKLAENNITSYRNKMQNTVQELTLKETKAYEERGRMRNRFNMEYPGYGLDGYEQSNEAYDKILDQCRLNHEPEYKEEFDKQYRLVYRTLRENVIASIHGEIKAAYRHRREINRMLSKIRFSDSTYQIDIVPAENENGQFYDMLMAEELDSKVIDHEGFDGQLSLGEDLFYEKYEKQIKLLTEKFMPPKDEDSQNRSLHKQQMEQYADYRNYLTFHMYERVENEDGSIKKNYVDEMAGKDSGGEGQNPKYVALLAGFAMLYMKQSTRDSKIRLVLLDEAFSKMDKERSEVCLRYARELELQLIVCVPDERLQSLIRNVDSVYGFRRYKNQISMMHIDKGDYLNLMKGIE